MSICDFFETKSGRAIRKKDYDYYYSLSNDCCLTLRYQENEQNQFESPMPWIGIYIALASLLCSLAMVADVFHGFRHRKLWFPCNYFTLNAASITLLAVAMKMPVDISTSMPTDKDQLVKLTSIALMSTSMANFMPSLGEMDEREILMNMIALAILVITIIVNVCIQLSTRLIDRYSFKKEYIAILSFMFILLLVLSFSSLAVSATKKILQTSYDDKHKKISRKEFTIENFKVNVMKYWMMAKSGSPQFVMARSVTSIASGAICFLVAATLAEAHLKLFIYYEYTFSYFSPHNIGTSYKWSIFVILVIQSFGVIVSTIAPTFRLFTAIRLRRLDKRVESYKNELKTENYWIQRLVGWRERTLDLQVRSQKWKKVVHNTKNLILNLCIGVQIVIVFASKLIMLISFVITIPFIFLFENLYKLLKHKLISKQTAGSESGPGTDQNLDLSLYVLHLEGEEELPSQFMSNNNNNNKNRVATDHFIQKGRNQQPKDLKELLEKAAAFKGVARFDSNQVPYLNPEEPPNCWSLTVVTLTSIAISLPNIGIDKVNWLLRSVREGLLYVNLVEKMSDAKGELVNIRNAADIVWLGVEVSGKWLDKDLRKMALITGNYNSDKILEKLVDVSKNNVIEFMAKMNGDQKENPLNWSIKVIAANSMYRISQTMLQDHHQGNKNDETLFEQLSVMIADILGACLTNLPRVMNMICYNCAIEKRENSVLNAAQLIGETEEILKILQQHELPNLEPDKLAYIDEWRHVFF